MFPTHMSMYHEAHNGAIWARDVVKPKTYGLICLNSPEMQKACQNVRDVLDAAGPCDEHLAALGATRGLEVDGMGVRQVQQAAHGADPHG